MSGSGGGGGGFTATTDDCATLVIDSQLSSPKPAVVASIQSGDELEVGLQPMGTTTVVVVLAKGQIAGGLASPLVPRLRECINSGTRYHATVTAKNDGQVQIRIRAA